MSEDERAFLRAICAEPGDDTPRLAFADWLDEHDQAERAEFIRVQCRVATLDAHAEPVTEDGYDDPDGADCCVCDELAELRRRERELLDSDGWPFTLDAGSLVVSDWERGFPKEVMGTAADWLAHADALTAAQPIERVMLTTWPEYSFEPPGLRARNSDMTYAKDDRGLILARRVPAVGDATISRLAESGDYPGLIRAALAAEWPGVTFELPPPLTTFATHGGDIVAGGWVSPVTDLPEAPLGIH